MTDKILTDEQKAIVEFVKAGEGNLLIEALAGTGKTSTIIESLKHLPQKSALLCAFNKKIADELTERMGPAPAGSMWKAATFHSLGLAIVKSHNRRIEVSGEATEELINEASNQWEADRIIKNDEGKKEKIRVSFPARRAAARLLRTIKETHTDRDLPYHVIRGIGETFNVFGDLSEESVDVACKVAGIAYEMSFDLKSRQSIDFCDMTWLPVALDLAPASRYRVVFVDEAQDLSLPQLSLVKKLVAPNGRLIVVGDRSQGIYGWRGAIPTQVWNEMTNTYQATRLPLTTTFRCSQLVVREANQVVPALKARTGAPPGTVSECSFSDVPELVRRDLRTKTFILSRNNADLLHTALYLYRQDIGFQLLGGKEIIEPLYQVIGKLDQSSKPAFDKALAEWHHDEMEKAEKIHAASWADRIDQQYKALCVMSAYVRPRDIKHALGELIGLDGSSITLSTVHKVKGLEADRVFLLKQTFARYRLQQEMQNAMSNEEMSLIKYKLENLNAEELHLEYVAVTRCKLDLYWVDMVGTSLGALARLAAAEGE
jgi:superfamily I DNA/RNA helicase